MAKISVKYSCLIFTDIRFPTLVSLVFVIKELGNDFVRYGFNLPYKFISIVSKTVLTSVIQ